MSVSIGNDFQVVLSGLVAEGEKIVPPPDWTGFDRLKEKLAAVNNQAE